MQILFFVGLKIVEILAFIFIPYWVGLSIRKTNSILDDEPPLLLWFIGLVGLTMLIAIVMLIVELSIANWEWAGKMIN